MGKQKGGKEKAGGSAGSSTGGSGSGQLRGASQVKVRHILCEKLSKANEALVKIQAGEAFAQVAKQYSEDKARSGGDLGWKRKDEVVPEFAAAAFQLQEGEYTKQPIKSAFGYHIILCEDRK